MMDTALLPIPGLSLMFMLGLRHGFDPDHIAIIDSMAYRALDRRPRLAPWTGTLFALGHGLAVTAIAVALGAFAGGMAPPPALRAVLDWLPTLLLILVGTLNLRDLLSLQTYRPRGWKSWLVPARLRDSSHPLAMFGTGVVFALVFDTATQAAAWGYAATANAGGATALAAGLAFTAGMVVTDSAGGRLMVRLLRAASGRADAAVASYRRRIGWTVVLMSYAMALYQIITALRPGSELDELAFTAIGCALFLGLLGGCGLLLRKRVGAAGAVHPLPKE
jgi:high-affinity nickel-transport protein